MSSDAKQIRTRAELDGDEWVINGEKFYISGAGDPRCKIMIVMVRTNPDADTYKQQSQILVPMDAPGVEIVGPMHVFGSDDAPHGHMHLRFTDVRVPKSNVLWGEGRGFELCGGHGCSFVVRARGLRWSPHSLCSGRSHHQRPARMSSPGWTGRVQGAQPMLG